MVSGRSHRHSCARVRRPGFAGPLGQVCVPVLAQQLPQCPVWLDEPLLQASSLTVAHALNLLLAVDAMVAMAQHGPHSWIVAERVVRATRQRACSLCQGLVARDDGAVVALEGLVRRKV